MTTLLIYLSVTLMAYFRTSTTTAKGRWFGKTLGEIASEFGPGAKTLGDQSHVVKIHDVIKYSVHMHEPPVPSPGFEIIDDDEDYVVVNKFGGIPTHPTVNYFRNTVTEELKPRYGALHPCYRLDRLTSGVLVFAKSPTVAADFVKRDDRDKIYYARVKGHFEETQTFNWPIIHYNSKRGYQEFLKAYNNGKPASTYVEPQRYLLEQNETIVKCVPLTGRTHQIRKHLSQAGYPIVNDTLYNDFIYARLYREPTEKNFIEATSTLHGRQDDKKTGEKCPECGCDIYKENIEEIWLHCSQYSLGDRIWKAASPSWLES